MHQVYLFVTLSQTGAVLQDVRYLHGTRDTQEEADGLCSDLNKLLVNARYGVVEEE